MSLGSEAVIKETGFTQTYGDGCFKQYCGSGSSTLMASSTYMKKVNTISRKNTILKLKNFHDCPILF